MNDRSRKHWWTWVGLAGVVVVLCGIGALIYRSLAIEVVAVRASSWENSHTLILGQTSMFHEYLKPADPQVWGDKEKDLSRLAAAYYHRFGPFGHVMERYNWFAGPQNTYWSDARLPASLLGTLATRAGPIPAESLAQLWTEPPVGVVYLQAAAAASYARPFQRIDFYEHNPEVAALFQPFGPKRTFSMLQDAAQRGADVRLFEGDEIEQLSKGPKEFYRVLLVETARSDQYFFRYSRNIVNERALQILVQAVTNDGIICFHTSNRHRPEIMDDVINLAKRAGFSAVRAFDMSARGEGGHFASVWVIVSRRVENLQFLNAPPPQWLPQPNNKRGGRNQAVDFRIQ